MEEPRRIFMWGNSLILGAIRASLQRLPNLEVRSLPAGKLEAPDLEKLDPDVIVFDLGASRPPAAFSLLESRPGLLILGVSPDSNLVKVWSGRQLRELSTQDLIEVMNGLVEDSPTS